MKNVIFVLVVALFSAGPGIQNQTCVPAKDVTLLELQKYSVLYDNCRVRVSGKYLANYGHHSVVLLDYSDPDQILIEIWLDFKDGPDVIKEYRNINMEEYVRLITSGELTNMLNKFTWVIPLPVKPLPDSQLEAAHRYQKLKEPDPADVVIVGRFDYAKQGRLIFHKDGQTSFIPGFGNNLRLPYRIVVEQLIFLRGPHP